MDDACYGRGLCKRLFPVTGSSRTSTIVKEWLCTDEVKAFFENEIQASRDIEVKRPHIRDLLVD